MDCVVFFIFPDGMFLKKSSVVSFNNGSEGWSDLGKSLQKHAPNCNSYHKIKTVHVKLNLPKTLT